MDEKMKETNGPWKQEQNIWGRKQPRISPPRTQIQDELTVLLSTQALDCRPGVSASRVYVSMACSILYRYCQHGVRAANHIAKEIFMHVCICSARDESWLDRWWGRHRLRNLMQLLSNNVRSAPVENARLDIASRQYRWVAKSGFRIDKA